MTLETTVPLAIVEPDKRTSNLQIAQRYFEAWNRRDADAIAGCFAEGATYSDPTAGKIAVREIGAYAQGLWAAFPDLNFEILHAASADEDLVVVQWMMRGTNTGSLQGLPPTGREIELPGADFIRVQGHAICSVSGYFDQKAIPMQLGLKTIVQPRQVGPFVFGTAAAAQSGKRIPPGAFSITSIAVRSEQEAERVRDYSFQIVQELLALPGFIGWTGVILGERLMTVTAWEDAEGPRQLSKSGTHKTAMADFYRGDLGSATFNSIWVPAEIKPTWVRCPACQTMNNYEKANGVCACGDSLPDPPPYW